MIVVSNLQPKQPSPSADQAAPNAVGHSQEQEGCEAQRVREEVGKPLPLCLIGRVAIACMNDSPMLTDAYIVLLASTFMSVLGAMRCRCQQLGLQT